MAEMKHLYRAGAILAGVLVLVLVVPRVVPIPAFLEAYGFHNEAPSDNEQRWASLPAQYAQTSTCVTCHQENYQKWENSVHSTVSCENCHGPAEAHLEGKIVPSIDRSREACGVCHAQIVGRPADFPQVDMAEKGGQAGCVTCHNPHDPLSSMPPKVPHSLEDRSDCQTCHAPHEPLETLPPRMPHKIEGRENCVSCHEK